MGVRIPGSPVTIVTVMKIIPCRWCGRGMPANPRGRPRQYCRQSHRQRAFEARRRAERMGLDRGETLVATGPLQDLNDRLYVLETALQDVERDLRSDPSDHRRAFQHLYTAAAPLRGAVLAPMATLEPVRR